MKGCFTALMTPFKDGKVDYAAFEKLLAQQLASDIDGVVPCGTTGEAPTLSHKEHDEVVEFVIRQVSGKLRVIAGAGSNATHESLRLSKHAAQAGADGLLLVSPYYNRPPQEGLYQHFRTIIAAVPCEAVIYNIPGRTSINVEVATFSRLADELPNFTTVKEATGSVDFASALKNAVPRLELMSGNDSLNLPLLSIGSVGCISVLSNLFPSTVKKLHTLYQAGDVTAASALHHKLLPITQALFLQSNPIPVKLAAYMQGILTTPDVRLPLTPASHAVKERLETALAQLSDLT